MEGEGGGEGERGKGWGEKVRREGRSRRPTAHDPENNTTRII